MSVILNLNTVEHLHFERQYCMEHIYKRPELHNKIPAVGDTTILLCDGNRHNAGKIIIQNNIGIYGNCFEVKFNEPLNIYGEEFDTIDISQKELIPIKDGIWLCNGFKEDQIKEITSQVNSGKDINSAAQEALCEY